MRQVCMAVVAVWMSMLPIAGFCAAGDLADNERRIQAEKTEDGELRGSREAKGVEELKQYHIDAAERKRKLGKRKSDPYSSCEEARTVNGALMWLPCDPDKKSPLELEHEKEEADKKRRCGKDFMALRIGMTLDRLEQCYEEPAFVTETVGKGGRVETYRGTFYFIHVRNGRVVGYTRRTR